jgi:DNA-binding FadR family transcriptional regulator
VFPEPQRAGRLDADSGARAKEARQVADWTKGQPAYQQVADVLRERIRAGVYREGEQLPSYAALMQEFDVSVTVTRSAIAMLRAEGLVSTHQGKGAFVLLGAGDAAPSRDAELAALRRDLDALAGRVAQLEAERSG